ncbi:MAG: hypothetical protein R2769_15090 [Saprospiraceae bacterium]
MNSLLGCQYLNGNKKNWIITVGEIEKIGFPVGIPNIDYVKYM